MADQSRTHSRALKSAKANSRPKSAAEVFAGQPENVRGLAQALRQLVHRSAPKLDEIAYGGAKVRITLYSLGAPSNVICGIQPAKDACLFYLHHVTPEDSAVVKIAGQGKHARQIRLRELTPTIARELRRLIVLAMQRAS